MHKLLQYSVLNEMTATATCYIFSHIVWQKQPYKYWQHS